MDEWLRDPEHRIGAEFLVRRAVLDPPNRDEPDAWRGVPAGSECARRARARRSASRDSVVADDEVAGLDQREIALQAAARVLDRAVGEELVPAPVGRVRDREPRLPGRGGPEPRSAPSKASGVSSAAAPLSPRWLSSHQTAKRRAWYVLPVPGGPYTIAWPSARAPRRCARGAETGPGGRRQGSANEAHRPRARSCRAMTPVAEWASSSSRPDSTRTMCL